MRVGPYLALVQRGWIADVSPDGSLPDTTFAAFLDILFALPDSQLGVGITARSAAARDSLLAAVARLRFPTPRTGSAPSHILPRAGTGLAFSVTDEDRRPIEGAAIRVISDRADTTLRSSDRSGEATFDNLPPGRYRIIVRRLAFKPVARDVQLPAQCQPRIAVRLRGYACDLVPDCVDAPSEVVVGDCQAAGPTD